MATIFELPAEETSVFSTKVKDASIIQQLATYIPSSNSRTKTVHQVDTAQAFWQINKGDEKQESGSTITPADLVYYPLVILDRIDKAQADDEDFLTNLLINEYSKTIGQAFDQSVVTGTGVPTVNFDNFSSRPNVTINSGDIYRGLLGAYQAISDNDYDPNGWALANRAKGRLLGSLDADGHPYFPTEASINNILGAPAKYQHALYPGGSANLGVTGDWSKAFYGDVRGVEIQKTGEGWELLKRNQIGIRVEAMLGFRLLEASAFVNLVLNDQSAKAITSFTLAGVAGVIDQGNKTISVTVPEGTGITSQTPVVTINGASYTPAGNKNFTTPQTYTVKAADNSTQDYVVTVTVADE